MGVWERGVCQKLAARAAILQSISQAADGVIEISASLRRKFGLVEQSKGLLHK